MNTENKQSNIIDLSLDWDFSNNQIFGNKEIHLDSISDALIFSLSNLGKVDIEYIMKITNEDYLTVISVLKGSIYQNPEKWNNNKYEGWETSEEYLSGNLRIKLREARNANKTYEGLFTDNINAIKKLIPDALDYNDIYITLGSPWIPVEIIEDFIVYILKAGKRTCPNVIHDEYIGTWEIIDRNKCVKIFDVAAYSTYGTSRINALQILEKTLNMKSIAIYDEEYSSINKSGKKRILNKKETILAIEKQQLLISTFQKWVWNDQHRKEKLESLFDSKYGCIRKRIFDGSFLKFPGMENSINLYPYQKNAVARILFSPNTLLAHDVGCGKTYVMIAAGMELKRMKLSNKNLYVVPNNILIQWRELFKKMYLNAKVLCVDSNNFTPSKRIKTLKEIRDNNWDAIIMTYSCFDLIPLSKEFLMEEVQNKKDYIESIQNKKLNVTSDLRRKKEELEKKLQSQISRIENDELIYFDELGIDRLFVDEAHNYKNVPLETKTDHVLGISRTGSKKCQDMLDKVRYIQRKNNGGGVIMATGTPITNSLTDVFIMQKYLQDGELNLLDLQTFDSWVGMFAEKVTDFEIDVDTNNYKLATRFSKFHNLPELATLLSSIADFHQLDEHIDIPKFNGYSNAMINKTSAFEKYLKEISDRAERVRKGMVNRKTDNMLKITIDGRKAALDLRLVDKNEFFNRYHKIRECVDIVYNIYKKNSKNKATQLIFCDISTPKESFNVYDEVKKMLLKKGVSDNEIAYIHDATNEVKRELLLEKVRNGVVRILLGSTIKLGMGVNVQDRLIAIHHLDVPWRPADMTQREGRILRQGNMNKKVQIYRYITSGSFDAYSWQLLEIKQRFISGILAGSIDERSSSDIDNTVLSYAEVKALAIGNPLIKKRCELQNELSRFIALHQKDIEVHLRLEKELVETNTKIAMQNDLIDKCLADLRVYRAKKETYGLLKRKQVNQKIAECIDQHIKSNSEEEITIINYCGFMIKLPNNMNHNKSYIIVEKNGKYRVELGESKTRVLIKIDNFLQKLSTLLKNMRNELEILKNKQKNINEEIIKKENFSERIESIQKELDKLDDKIGVKK